jgi:hypothetical protein
MLRFRLLPKNKWVSTPYTKRCPTTGYFECKRAPPMSLSTSNYLWSAELKRVCVRNVPNYHSRFVQGFSTNWMKQGDAVLGDEDAVAIKMISSLSGIWCWTPPMAPGTLIIYGLDAQSILRSDGTGNSKIFFEDRNPGSEEKGQYGLLRIPSARWPFSDQKKKSI